MSQTSNRYVIGIDVGGTKVAAGFVDSNGEIIKQVRVPMVSDRDAAAGLAAVVSAVRSLLSGEEARATLGIGICSPGPLDPEKGIVLNPPNLPCWRYFPLAEELRQAFGLPVSLDNDANAAALAEARWGAGKPYRYVFYGTLGTGVGTGIIFDGRIYRGRTGAAGEGGHMSIDRHGPLCKCGKPGCIEIFASGPAIAVRARAVLASEISRPSLLRELAHGNIETVTGEMVGEAYARGDLVAKEILGETAGLIALWLSNIVDLLDPDVVILGGGVSCLFVPFFSEIRRRLAQLCVNPHAAEIPLAQAHYKADTGIAGGAALCSHLF